MFAKIAASVAVGFLGAYPLASSSGLMGMVSTDNQGSVIVASGIILFFLAASLIGPTLRLIGQTLETLGRVEERPRPSVAWTMLVLGTACALSAMYFQFQAGSRPPSSVSMNLPGFTMTPSGTSPGVAVESAGSLGLGILTILTFLLGASMIGLGIWASIKPSARTVGPAIKPEAREFAEVATA